MRRRRAPAGGLVPPDWQLGRGPGNLTRAFAVTLAQNRAALTDGPLMLCSAPRFRPAVRWTRRIGISVGADIRLFTDFAEFSSELATQLGSGRPAIALTASGSYDAASVTLHTTHIAVHLAPN